MGRLFGPASAALVDRMGEDECVSICRGKVAAMYKEEKAKQEFDAIGLV